MSNKKNNPGTKKVKSFVGKDQKKTWEVLLTEIIAEGGFKLAMCGNKNAREKIDELNKIYPYKPFTY